MKTRKDCFAWLLDRLSGTYPNDERTSRINEKGFALCGLCYIPALLIRTVRVLLYSSNYSYVKETFTDKSDLFIKIYNKTHTNSHIDPSVFAPAVLLIMLCIILGITVKQRRKESPVQRKARMKLRLTELPRAAAALLSGKSPEDERTVHAFERGFAVCGLLGFGYYGFCWLFLVWCRFPFSPLILMCAAPVLLSFVKLRGKILTPPRFAHIRLNIRHLLLRLPVYLLAVLPYLAFISFAPTLYSAIGGPDNTTVYSESLLIMFFQVLRDGFINWIGKPKHLNSYALFYAAMIYLLVVIIHEFTVWFYRKQMQKMDAEENDLS